jgi:hypothetical protein
MASGHHGGEYLLEFMIYFCSLMSSCFPRARLASYMGI